MFVAIIYRVTHQFDNKFLLTSIWKLHFSIRSLYCDGTFVLMSTKACNQPDGPPCSHALVLRMFWFYLEERRQRPESRRLTDASSLRTFISLSLLLLFPRKLSPIGCSSAKPVASASASVHIQASRADRKSQVRQCLGFCTADFLFSLSYKSAEQKTQTLPKLRLPISSVHIFLLFVVFRLVFTTVVTVLLYFLRLHKREKEEAIRGRWSLDSLLVCLCEGFFIVHDNKSKNPGQGLSAVNHPRFP